MSTLKVTLEEILRAREYRARKQVELCTGYDLPVVCFTMNIAGDVKKTPLIELAFFEGIRRIEKNMRNEVCCDIFTADTGCEAYFVFDMPAADIKRIAVKIEEDDALARLFDIDVLNAGGEKLSREVQRECIVCGKPVAACARSRAHSIEEISDKTDALLTAFAARYYADLAYDALLNELETTPKPGLVDRNNSGAHADMSYASFVSSADAIAPYFEKMALAALMNHELSADKLMTMLRKIGVEAEEAMFKASGGANTHKGAIYSMGLLLAGAALALRRESDLLEEAQTLAQSHAEKDYANAKNNPQSHGEKLFVQFGVRGARGEAANGFPHAVKAAGYIDEFLSRGYEQNTAYALTLPKIMAELEDTNILHRGGKEALLFAQANARMIDSLPIDSRFVGLRALDAEFVQRNISPGGSADVLATAILLYKLQWQ